VSMTCACSLMVIFAFCLNFNKSAEDNQRTVVSATSQAVVVHDP
jgi:hypothetical protein